MVPLSEAHVKYLLSWSKERSQICVGVEPRRNSPRRCPDFGSKTRIKVPYMTVKMVNKLQNLELALTYPFWSSGEECAITIDRDACDLAFVSLNSIYFSLLNGASWTWCLWLRCSCLLVCFVTVRCHMTACRRFIRTALNLHVFEPCKLNVADLLCTSGDTKLLTARDRMKTAWHCTVCLDRCKGLNLPHFHAGEHIGLRNSKSDKNENKWDTITNKLSSTIPCVYLHILRVEHADRIACELVDPSYEFYLAVIPKVNMVWRILRV